MLIEMTMRRRPGFTLIEMMVVLVVIVTLATLAAVYYPRLADSNQMIRGSDKVVQALSNARARAKRDGLPTGVRFGGDPTTGYVTDITYIQQPDNYTFGKCEGSYPIPGTNPQQYDTTVVDFSNVDFQGAAAQLNDPDSATVQPGDYLEVFGGGGVFRIIGALKPTDPPNPKPTGTTGWLKMNNASGQLIYPTSNYRIIRQPRKLIGEDPVALPKNIVLDFGAAYSRNVPKRQVPIIGTAGTVDFYEILFAPSGSVIGQGTGSDKIILWLHDLTQPRLEAPDPAAGSPVLISVQVRTGFIAVQPVGPAGSEFIYTKDPRSSGL